MADADNKLNAVALLKLLESVAELNALLAKDKTGEHSHKCEKCGHVWSHEDSCLNDVEHHTCKCGVEQWYVFNDKREGDWQSCAAFKQSGVGGDAEPKQSTEEGK